MEAIPLDTLKKATNDFSDDQKLGIGGYGVVYKGTYKGKLIAVKRLHDLVDPNGELFRKELSSLQKVQHPNIVELVGYSYEVKYEYVKFNNEHVFAKHMHRILCFEYLHGGSLDKHLSEVSSGHDWCTRYKIIKGICDGLKYLHEEEDILHQDLKPANILLDESMKPKIADFGLSRLFSGSKAHTTKISMGTIRYMPPEFILKRHISKAYDIYSLGIIIIDIMTGPDGYDEFQSVSNKEVFLKQVQESWQQRIASATLDASKILCCKQVEICAQIAIDCVVSNEVNRPKIATIINMLNQTEVETIRLSSPRGQEECGSTSAIVNLEGEMKDYDKILQHRIINIGPWGGNNGNPKEVKVMPKRLISVTVRSGWAIYSIAFTYIDDNGQQYSAGPWGTFSAQGHDVGSIDTILLCPSERLIKISGTIGRSTKYKVDVVTSLTLTTNVRTYGPYGGGGGCSFYSPVQSNCSIVGFFANIGEFVDAIGVYVITVTETEEEKTSIVKIGPWGGHSGNHHDIVVAPRYLKSIIICCSEAINSLAFSYTDDCGDLVIAGPWGSTYCDGGFHTIQLGPSEFMTSVSGTTGFCSKYSVDVITSLTFTTNARTYGPYGRGGGTPFNTPALSNGSIVGFFARAGEYVDAVGVYGVLERETTKEACIQPQFTKLGLWGGSGGYLQDIQVLSRRLISVTVCSGEIINSLAFTYFDDNGQQCTAGPWGGSGGPDAKRFHTIQLGPSEVLQEISGTFGPCTGFDNALTSLEFRTNKGIYGPYGGGGCPFSSPKQSNGYIVGFFAHTGGCIDSIGIYVA